MSVLFFGLLLTSAPVPADDTITLDEVMTVIGRYIPVPTLSVPIGAQPGVNTVGPGGGSLGPELGYLERVVQQSVKKAIKEALEAASALAGDTPARVCHYYGEARNSPAMSAARLVVAALALAHMWLDLTEDEIFGTPKLENAELKKQLEGFMALVAVGGLGDRMMADFCNLTGNPLPS